MGEGEQYQLLNELKDRVSPWATLTTDHEPRIVPMLITKKWLCVHFDLVYPGGRVNIRALYSKVLTPAVIRSMGMSEAEIRSPCLKTFDRQQTVLLIKLLDL
jgi:hypothetical protein